MNKEKYISGEDNGRDISCYEEVEEKQKEKKPPKCLACGTELKPVKDTIAKKFTGYLWYCPKCDSKRKRVISIG